MSEYTIRKANESDIPFLTDVVIEAEKSNCKQLSFSTLFNLSEETARKHIASMFDEEIDGCEFSLSNYLIVEYEGKRVAGLGAWIEAFDGNQPSAILKSNLISYTFGKDAVAYLKTKAHLIKGMLTEREPMTLQIEYLFVDYAHRGKKLGSLLFRTQEDLHREKYPELKKVQLHLFGNNYVAQEIYKKMDYVFVSSHKSDEPETMEYLPYNEKIIMEKTFK
jgi:ribosomal protein S18 acetylase RimI-like enzyme